MIYYLLLIATSILWPIMAMGVYEKEESFQTEIIVKIVHRI